MISSASRTPLVALELRGSAGDSTAGICIPCSTLPGRTDPTADTGELPGAPATVRIQAADLRQARAATERLRLREAQAGREPDGLVVLLDVEFLIAADARTARAEFSRQNSCTHPDHSATVRYVGTPRGLAGLISDIRAASVADGVTLIPLAERGNVEMVTEQVLPLLDLV